MDQEAKVAEAYHAGREACRHDPEGRGDDPNPYHRDSSMWDQFERGLREEAEKQAK